MSQLTNQIAVVTGAGRGIGRAIALKFAAEGADVVCVSRTQENSEKVAAEIRALGRKAWAHAVDVADAAAVSAAAEKILAETGKVDILVNNAGTNLKARSIRELTPEAWEQMIAANLNGAFYCTHAVLPQMLERKDGVIVNVVSIAGKRGNPLGGAAYCASKFGMGGFGMVLSNEERESGIRVSNIYPGEIDTPILANRPRPVTDEQRKVILKPEDVAAAVLYVAGLPPHVSVPELIIKPTVHNYW